MRDIVNQKVIRPVTEANGFKMQLITNHSRRDHINLAPGIPDTKNAQV